MIDAIDHDRPDPAMPGILDELRAKYPDITFQWGSLSEFADEVLKYQDQLPEFEGELRWPARDVQRVFQCLIPHTTSSRYPLKQRNSQCQALLEKWAEPFSLLQQMAGGEPILKYLDKAWEYLLRNHPHDSICGCSIDQVHRDMMYRFDQAELRGDITTKRAMVHLGALNDSDAALRNVVIHNPLPFRRKGVVAFPLHFAKGWPQTHRDVLSSAEMVNRFHLVTKDGERVPYQVARIDRDVTAKRLCPDNRESARVQDVYEVVAELDLPPCGYTALHVEETGDANRPPKGMYKGGLSAENEHLAVTFRSDGSASLKEKASGLSLDNLFLYEDTGDSGDGWSYGRLSSDIAVLSPGTRCTTAVTGMGPLRTVFRIERELDLPAGLDIVTNKRGERRETLRIVDHVAIEKGAPFLRVHTEVWNTCEDHRLRVLFPTHLNAAVSFAESPFAVVERAIEVPEEARVWHERVCPENPFTTFCGVQDGARGLAVLAPFGPHEYEVMDTDDRALAITLFRSNYKTVSTSGEPDGQLLGKMTFDYLLYPFAGRFDVAKASRFVAEAQAGVRTHGAAEMPEECWRFEATPTAAIVTALKPADDGQGGIVRFWNPTTKVVQQEFRANPRVTTAWSCTLNEENGQSLDITPGGCVTVEVPARGLATVRFGWK